MSERPLPTGTVTFLFTDIEGSTELVTRLGEGYRDVLETHHRLLRAAFQPRGGIEISTEGDAFFVVFERPTDAVLAAVEAQRALGAAAWPTGVEVRVRIGIHSGEGVLGGDNYTGIDVHRGARIMGAAHGGQILVSGPTHGLVERSLPEGVSFHDLGEHRLRGLPEPERLRQVVAEGLRRELPPLRTVDARPNNLPRPATTFVGRRRELDEIEENLRGARLLTLTGPGGAGKTRLSIQAARELLPEHEDGAFFVALAPIRDPALVAPTIAEALGLREAADRSSLDQVIEHVRDREILLVLDNVEQVVDAAGDIGQVLVAGDRVRILATSREPLGLQGEREYPVPPLGVPDPEHLPPLEAIGQYEAVALFVERATAVNPGFAVTNENAPAVAEICTRLDGLPLAIELAAARVKILSPLEILQRLEDRLSFLSTRERDRPDRQQTLRAAIAWSYELLEERERDLFARLAVFSRGFRLEAAEAVSGLAGDQVFDLVASLVNKSLIRQVHDPAGATRFLMLETIREFAAERLAELADAEDVRRRHARFFLGFAADMAPKLFGAEQAPSLSALAAEHDNVRAALEWAQAAGETEIALRLSAALWRFWQMRGHLREAADRFRAVLSMPGSEAFPEARAEALEGAGGVHYWMSDWDPVEAYYGECLEIRRRLGEPKGIADALYNFSFVFSVAPEPRRDASRAREILEEALARYRELDDRRGVANVLWALSTAHQVENAWTECAEVAREALDLFLELDDRFGAAWSAHSLGLASTALGNLEEAEKQFRAAMGMFHEAGDLTGIGLVLYDFAALAATRNDYERALRLREAAAASEQRAGQGLVTNMETYYPWLPDFGERGVTPEREAELRLEGADMSTDEAVAYALGAEPGSSGDAEVP